MSERPLARSVLVRQRLARVMQLGDRNSPVSWTPALVTRTEDPEMPISLAPFSSSRESDNLPASITMSTRAELCFPFDSDDTWSASEGLVLPPSLSESDSGEFSRGDQLLAVSWQSMHHDEMLNDSKLQPSVICLTDSVQLANNPGLLIEALYTLRTRFPNSLIWTPGIGGPDNCALLVWMGVDLFDLGRSSRASSMGTILSQEGPRIPEHTLSESHDMGAQIEAWKHAIGATRSAIRNGSLRELAERQSTSSPRSVERLRRHDKMMSKFGGGKAGLERVVGHEHKLRCHTYQSRDDPLIQDWRARVADSHMPPKHQRNLLVLLPCSAVKPYRTSQSHRRFMSAITTNSAHQVMVTAPLGLVPRELEEIWPAANYDIPVTGDWDLDELEVIRDMLERLCSRVGYSRIINHSGVDINIEGIEITDTRKGESAGSADSIERLRNAISQADEEMSLNSIKKSQNTLEQLRALSRFQHGTDAWLEDAAIRGRPPIFTIMKGGEQIAMWNPRTGRFAFSKACLPLLMQSGTFPIVELSPDLDWKGDLFSSNVIAADSNIRIGDEILVIQKDSLVGSARAEAAGWEWPEGAGRLAKSQHRL
jgi:archaeosine synthase